MGWQVRQGMGVAGRQWSGSTWLYQRLVEQAVALTPGLRILRSAASLLAFAAGLVWILLVTAFERSPLEYRHLPATVITKTVRRGTDASIGIERCNTSSETIFYTVTRRLVNVGTGDEVSLPSYSIDLDPGCKPGVGLPVPIPSSTPPGRYVDRGISHFEGHVKHFAIHWDSEPFEVTE